MIIDGKEAMKQASGLFSSQSFARSEDKYSQVSVGGLDAAWISENGMEAIAVKGQKIVRFIYLDGKYTAEGLTKVLKALAQRWAEY